MEDLIFDQLLFDNYSGLLTKKQQKVLSLYFEEDLSFTEIAETLNISRQAVFDLVKRSLKALNNFEDSLKLVERDLQNRKTIEKIKSNIEEIIKEYQIPDKVKQILLKDIILLEEIAN